MVKFVWVKFINVQHVNRKHKPCWRKEKWATSFLHYALFVWGFDIHFSLLSPSSLYTCPLYDSGVVNNFYWMFSSEIDMKTERGELGTLWLPVLLLLFMQPLSSNQHNLHSNLIHICGYLGLVSGPCWALQLQRLEQIETERVYLDFWGCCLTLNLPFLPPARWRRLSIQLVQVSLIPILTAIWSCDRGKIILTLCGWHYFWLC